MLLKFHLKQPLTRLLLQIVLISAASAYVGKFAVDPTNIRTLLGVTLIFFMVALSTIKPGTSVILVVIYLSFMGLLRRALIPISGWGAFDPLVLVGPSVGLLLGSYWFYRRLFLREPVLHDTPVFRLVRWMIFINLIEVANPRQGGLTVGLSAIIFYIAPLLWMVTARTAVSEKALRVLMHVVFVTGIVAALYGLKQTYYGFYPFEQQWISIVHMTSLKVGNIYRAISTTDNPQEYAQFLAQAVCVGWLYILRGRSATKILGIAGVGIIGWALFMESARGPLILAAIAVSVMTVTNAPTSRIRVITAIAVTLLLTGVILKLAHMHTSNALVAHQIGGITGQNSTLNGHLSTIVSGVWRGTKSVVGYGLGSTTTAASKFSASNAGTEAGFSNMFLSDGPMGGIVYLILMVRVLITALRETHNRSTLSLFALGVLIATWGQWMNGELYTTATVVWIYIGYLDKLSSLHTIELPSLSGGTLVGPYPALTNNDAFYR